MIVEVSHLKKNRFQVTVKKDGAIVEDEVDAWMLLYWAHLLIEKAQGTVINLDPDARRY